MKKGKVREEKAKGVCPKLGISILHQKRKLE